MTWKVINISDTGTASKFGGDDLDKISRLFSAIDVDDVDLNADWTFRSGKLYLRNPANTFSYTFTGGAIGANRNITYPVLTGDDVPAFQAHTQTLTNKTMDRALNTFKLQDPFKYTIFIDANDSNKIKCRDNDSGTIVSSDNSNAKVPIQFAIDNANGKRIFIQRGVYNLSSGLDLKEKFANIEGEKGVEYYEAVGGSANGNTILKKNYTAAAGDIFIDCFGATDFWYVDLRNLVIEGDDEGIGLKYNHNVRLLDNVYIREFRTGVIFNNLVYTNINNLFVEDCIDYGVQLWDCNTTYFYGGRINFCNINVLIQDGGDYGFFGTTIEHGISHCVYLDSSATVAQPNCVGFYRCSFESNNIALVSLVKCEGSGVTFDQCRFDSSNTNYTMVHLTGNAKDNEFHSCYWQANTVSTTAIITIDSGAERNRFLFNKKHRGGQITTLTFTDNGTDTLCFGNQSISDKIPLSITFSGTNTFSANTTLEAGLISQGFTRFEGDISPTQLTGDVSDYNPTGLSTATRIRLSGDSSFRTITGLQGGADGRLLKLTNVSTGSILLKDQSTASATAANRFDFGGYDIPLLPSNSLEIIYDSTDSRWKATSSQLLVIPDPKYGYYYNRHGIGTANDGNTTTTAASGGTVGLTTPIAGHPGIVNFTLGTSTTGTGNFTTNGGIIILGNSWYWRYDAIIRIVALSDGTNTYTLRVGFIDSGSAESTDGVFFRYTNSVNSGKWVLVTRSNNAESTFNATNTAVAAATWYHLTAIVNPAGTVAEFYQDGTFLGNVTSNIPTGAGRSVGFGMMFLKSAGTADNSVLDIDSFGVVAYSNVSM